jgi:uncharacterized membrane protein YqaE (UPF0057 family)
MTEEDYLRTKTYIMIGMKQVKRMLIIIRIIIPFIGLYILGRVGNTDRVANVLVIVICLILSIFFNKLIQIKLRKMIRKSMKKGNYDFNNNTVNVESDYVELISKTGTMKWYWNSISNIESIEGIIYIFNQQFQVITIPERAFENKEQSYEFIEYVKKRLINT